MRTEQDSSLRVRMRLVRGKPLVSGALLAALVAGPLFARTVFPEAPLSKQLVGGWIAGVYFALCALPEHFLDL